MMDNRKVIGMLQSLAKRIESKIPHDALFVLMVTPKGEKGRAHYVSNASRDDVVESLREFADALERGLTSDDRPQALN